MTDKTNHPITKMKSSLAGILLGYAQVFFCTKWSVGLFFLIATFTIPAQGTAGLLALVLSNLWALVLGLSKEHVKEGYFAYNGVLIGLALGLMYEVNSAFFIMLFIVTLLGVLVAASLRAAFERYLFIPVLSTPFVLTTWVIMAAGRQFGGLKYTLVPYENSFLAGVLPPLLDFLARSLGATFFQLGTLAGILVAAGLLLFSRQAFVLAVTGLASGSLIYVSLGGDISQLTTGLIGFNFALTAIAVGGVWSVPGLQSFFLAAAGGAICAVIAAALSFLLQPLDLPALAFPFVATTNFIIYALKHRTVGTRFPTVAIPASTPEENLKRHKNARSRFVTGEVPVFDLPVSGAWTVTQGFNGAHTHKGAWMHGWDFEILNEEGRKYRKDGSVLENFYSFDMPVFAPADGKVVAVVNHIEDNPIGQINPKNNWGNGVVIWHYASVYTALYHLKMGSVQVSEGEVVRYGQVIGKVGNSGRSPYPHLHLQVQSSHEIGAPTIPSELMHYVRIENGAHFYYTHGCPARGDRIGPLQTESSLFDTASFFQGGPLRFWLRSPDKEWGETWETDIDLFGDRYLLCRQQNARIQFFLNRKVLLFLNYEGPRNVGLYWFFMAVPRLPMTTSSVWWNDELPGEMTISSFAGIFFDLVEPFFPLAKLSSFSQLTKVGRKISVETVLTPMGPLTNNRGAKITAVSTFELYKGLISLRSTHGEEILFELGRNDQRDGHMT